ncbi:MAG: glycosyltransferase, partial [Nitrososphaerota archaeon]
MTEKQETYLDGIQREKVTVVLPTLDEEEAIGELIEEINEAGYRKVLVVDGYSKDRTREIAQQKGAKVIVQHGKGKAGAVLAAKDKVDTEYFLLMDGDGTYDPRDIDKFTLHADQYDHIIGYRAKGCPNISKTHRLGNWILTKTFNILIGSNVPDVACGMYLMRTEKVRQLTIDEFGFVVDQEIAVQMLSDGKVTYVPISYRKRKGKAKAPTWRQGFRALFTIFKLASKYSPVLLFSLFASIAVVPAVFLLGYSAYAYIFHGVYH